MSDFRARLLRAGAVLALCLGAAVASADAPEPRLRLRLRGLRSDGGVVRCLLFSGPEGFPDRVDKSAGAAVVAIRDRAAACEFARVPPGTYAVTAYHDENNNDQLDLNWLGIPKEGIAATNDARGTMGPPKWKDAHFSYKGGPLDLTARMFY